MNSNTTKQSIGYIYKNPFNELVEDFFKSETDNFNLLTKTQQEKIESEEYYIFMDNYKLYISDQKLNNSTINSYYINQLLYNPERLLFTSQIEGIPENNNCRFLVISNMIHEIPWHDYTDNEHKDIRLATTDIISCFKIIDIYKRDNKTQITLIHYPITQESFFKNHKTNIEKELVPKLRQMFDLYSDKNSVDNINNEEYKDFFNEHIGIRTYQNQYKFFSKNIIVLYLQLLSNLCDKFGLINVLEFVDNYNMQELINSIETIYIEVFDSVNYFSEEERNKTISIKLNQLFEDISIFI